MEETVYYFCKKDLIMEDGDEAFTKGKFYKMLEKHRDGGVDLLNNEKGEHTLTKKYKKRYMVKVRDESLLEKLQRGARPFGTYFLCKKTMQMNPSGNIAFKKGHMYECTDEDRFVFNSDVGDNHGMGDAEFVSKYLVEIGE